jgi:hypothetical protein
MRIPTTRDIRMSWAGRKAAEFCNKSWVAKTIAIMIIWGIVAIPAYIYLLVRWGIGPETFWEELALLFVAILAIGWLQGILLFFGIILSIVIIAEDL